jgi:hypothetical protein
MGKIIMSPPSQLCKVIFSLSRQSPDRDLSWCFDVLCDSEKGNPYFEVVVTQRLKQPGREWK